jgi:phage virion morphogenesis protein
MEIILSQKDAGIEAGLQRVLSRFSDLSPLMQQIGAFYERRVLENFQNESAPDGTPWQPLAQDTMLIGLKRNKGWKKNGGLSAKGKRYITGKRLLYEKGDLMGSVHFQADSHSVTIGTGGSIPYAAIQQLGGKAGRGKKVTIPARPYLAMNAGDGMELAGKDRAWVMDMIRDYLKVGQP